MLFFFNLFMFKCTLEKYRIQRGDKDGIIRKYLTQTFEYNIFTRSKTDLIMIMDHIKNTEAFDPFLFEKLIKSISIGCPTDRVELFHNIKIFKHFANLKKEKVYDKEAEIFKTIKKSKNNDLKPESGSLFGILLEYVFDILIEKIEKTLEVSNQDPEPKRRLILDINLLNMIKSLESSDVEEENINSILVVTNLNPEDLYKFIEFEVNRNPVMKFTIVKFLIQFKGNLENKYTTHLLKKGKCNKTCENPGKFECKTYFDKICCLFRDDLDKFINDPSIYALRKKIYDELGSTMVLECDDLQISTLHTYKYNLLKDLDIDTSNESDLKVKYDIFNKRLVLNILQARKLFNTKKVDFLPYKHTQGSVIDGCEYIRNKNLEDIKYRRYMNRKKETNETVLENENSTAIDLKTVLIDSNQSKEKNQLKKDKKNRFDSKIKQKPNSKNNFHNKTDRFERNKKLSEESDLKIPNNGNKNSEFSSEEIKNLISAKGVGFVDRYSLPDQKEEVKETLSRNQNSDDETLLDEAGFIEVKKKNKTFNKPRIRPDVNLQNGNNIGTKNQLEDIHSDCKSGYNDLMNPSKDSINKNILGAEKDQKRLTNNKYLSPKNKVAQDSEKVPSVLHKQIYYGPKQRKNEVTPQKSNILNENVVSRKPNDKCDCSGHQSNLTWSKPLINKDKLNESDEILKPKENEKGDKVIHDDKCDILKEENASYKNNNGFERTTYAPVNTERTNMDYKATHLNEYNSHSDISKVEIANNEISIQKYNHLLNKFYLKGDITKYSFTFFHFFSYCLRKEIDYKMVLSNGEQSELLQYFLNIPHSDFEVNGVNIHMFFMNKRAKHTMKSSYVTDWSGMVTRSEYLLTSDIIVLIMCKCGLPYSFTIRYLKYLLFGNVVCMHVFENECENGNSNPECALPKGGMQDLFDFNHSDDIFISHVKYLEETYNMISSISEKSLHFSIEVPIPACKCEKSFKKIKIFHTSPLTEDVGITEFHLERY